MPKTLHGLPGLPHSLSAVQPPHCAPPIMQKPSAAAPAAEEAPAAEPAAALKAKAAAAAGAEAPPAKADPSAALAPSSGGLHLTKRPEMKRVESVGLVSNESLNEEEVEHFFAPEGALEEEERLRKEREERQAAADPPAEVGAGWWVLGPKWPKGGCWVLGSKRGWAVGRVLLWCGRVCKGARPRGRGGAGEQRAYIDLLSRAGLEQG